jgi:hypothetical protein
MRRVDVLVVGAVGAVVLLAVADSLRTDEQTGSVPVAATRVSDVAAVRRARADYIHGAALACGSAAARLDALDEEPFAKWSAAAARIMRGAVAEIGALPVPPASEREVSAFEDLLWLEQGALAQAAAAAAAGNIARAQRLEVERVRRSGERRRFVVELQGRWDVPTLRLMTCPTTWTQDGRP